MNDNINQVDRVGLSLLYNRLKNICDEMAMSMMRTAYSPIFSEGLDFSTLILDKRGQLIATAGLNPAMLGASLYAATWVISEVGEDNFNKGDVYCHNDPYRGGSHMPEHMLVTPMFIDDELVAYLGNIAHLAEIGGMAPGSFAADATDIFQEGLRIPPVKLIDKGEPVQSVWRIILSNHRTPANSWGDIHAMLGSLHVGEKRLRLLFDEIGIETLDVAFEQMIDYAEEYMRSEIEALPDGIYYGEDCMEDDGIIDRPYWIRCRVIIDGDQVIFDFAESDEQAIGPINAPYVVTLSAALNGLLYVLAKGVPVNAGITRAVKVVAPAGTITCVKLPGPCVGGQTEFQPRIMELIQGIVMSQIYPERTAAASGNTSFNFLFGGVDPRNGEYYAHYHFEAMGWGGRKFSDGNDAQIVPHANCRNTPVEIFETKFPWIHHEYRLNDEESPGIGKHRGGYGIRRVMEVMGEVITVRALVERMKFKPWGLFEGAPGTNAKLEVKRVEDTDYQTFQEAYNLVSPSKFTNVRLHKGDLVRITSPSGGGYGNPYERNMNLVLDDFNQGLLTKEDAKRFYGVILNNDNSLDTDASQQYREEILEEV